MRPILICLRLFWHWARLAASRTFCTAGKSKPTRTAMIAITTNSSISVKPRKERKRRRDDIIHLHKGERDQSLLPTHSFGSVILDPPSGLYCCLFHLTYTSNSP